MRYLSDSAYWQYLMHPPVVFLFQLLVAQTGLALVGQERGGHAGNVPGADRELRMGSTVDLGGSAAQRPALPARDRHPIRLVAGARTEPGREASFSVTGRFWEPPCPPPDPKPLPEPKPLPLRPLPKPEFDSLFELFGCRVAGFCFRLDQPWPAGPSFEKS